MNSQGGRPILDSDGLSAKIVTDPTGGFRVRIFDRHGELADSGQWAQTLWGARRLGQRGLNRERKERARGSRTVEEIS